MKRIPVTELKVGMKVVDSGLSWTDHPLLYSVPGEIRSEAQLKAIIKDGYRDAFVEGEGSGPEESLIKKASSKKWNPGAQLESYKQEIGRAKKLYDDALTLSRKFVADLRSGHGLDLGGSEYFVEGVVQSVAADSEAMVSLTKLRAFDEYTFTHSVNVSVLAVAFGRFLELPEKAVKLLGTAGLLHDVGKALIPETILNKPGKLTPEEFNIIKGHPDKGREVLQVAIDLGHGLDKRVIRAITEHHERRDGMGYPQGLSGEKIAPMARILSIVDIYDALTSERVYKPGMPPKKALGIIYNMREKELFPKLVERFIKCLGVYPVGSLVRLSTGEAALVAASNPEAPLNPLVRLVLDSNDKPMPPRDLNLSLEHDDPGNGAVRIVDCLNPKSLGVDPAAYLIPNETPA